MTFGKHFMDSDQLKSRSNQIPDDQVYVIYVRQFLKAY